MDKTKVSAVEATKKTPKGDAPRRPSKPFIQDLVQMFWFGAPLVFFDFSDLEEKDEGHILPRSPDSKYLRILSSPGDELLYIRSEDRFAYWKERYYAPLPDENLPAIVRKFLENEAQVRNFNVDNALVKNVTDALTSSPPKEISMNQAPYLLALKDKVLDFSSVPFRLIDPSPALPILRYLPVHSSEFNIPTPHFDNLLRSAFPSDPDMQAFILEMLAYYFIPHDDEPAIFFLYGVPASGKSTILDLLYMLLSGPRFYSAVSLEALTTDKFIPAQLAGKLANIYDEDQSNHVDLGKLKLFSSHRPVEVQRKFGQPFTLKPYAKFIFASNQLPGFSNVDAGFMRRVKPIEFMHSIPPEKRNKHLTAHLKAELPGIVGKILKAAEAFVNRNQMFNEPEKIAQALREFRTDMNPMVSFMQERYYTEPIPALTIERLKKERGRTASLPEGCPSPWQSHADTYDAYVEHCHKHNNKPLSRGRFARQFRVEYPMIHTEHFRDGDYRLLIPKKFAHYFLPSQDQTI